MARINLDPSSQGKEESETIRKLTKDLDKSSLVWTGQGVFENQGCFTGPPIIL